MSLLQSAGRVVGVFVGLAVSLAVGLWVKSLFDEAEKERAGVTVYVDNFSDREVTVRVDGTDWVTAGRRTSQTMTTMTEGAHRVEVVAGGAVLEGHDVRVENGGKYVLNVLGRQVYTSREVNYSAVGTAPYSPRDDRHIRDGWFQATEEFVFTDPPETLTMPGGASSATRHWLFRDGPVEPPAPDGP